MKKKYVNIAFIYSVLAMIGGVFYREFPKLALTGQEVRPAFVGLDFLSKVHVHLFIWGMFFFLILALITARTTNIEQDKKFNLFMFFYNLGLNLTVIMMLVRGIKELQTEGITERLDHIISGLAGLGHIMFGVGIILFFIILRKALKEEVAN